METKSFLTNLERVAEVRADVANAFSKIAEYFERS